MHLEHGVSKLKKIQMRDCRWINPASPETYCWAVKKEKAATRQ